MTGSADTDREAREERIRVRTARPGDAPLLRQWRAEPSLQRFQPLPEATLYRIQAELEAQRIDALYKDQGEKFQWLVEVEGRPAGWITLVIINWPHGLAEVGYALSTPYQGKQIMAKAMRVFLEDIFRHTSLYRLEARCAVENTASIRILEKLGFTREGILREYFELHGERVDNYLYALLREEVEFSATSTESEPPG